VNAAKYNVYKANVVIVSGDITGKSVVPIIRQPDGSFNAMVPGKIIGAEHKASTEAELKEVEKIVRNSGYYPYQTTPEEVAELEADKTKIGRLIQRLTLETLKGWVQLVEERLRGSGVKFILTPGNDDMREVDAVLNESDFIINAEGKCILIDDQHEMITTGYTNVTPWKTPREFPEKELASYIGSLTSQVKDMSKCIFNFHCPPYDSSLDTAPKLDENWIPTPSALEGYVMAPAGSTAVREAIEKHQPLLGLHGHIHECAGEVKIGRTLCLNPGSEYHDGALEAYIVDLEKDKVKFHLHVEA
jgi:Icc-related predicted phosphoesterase